MKLNPEILKKSLFFIPAAFLVLGLISAYSSSDRKSSISPTKSHPSESAPTFPPPPENKSQVLNSNPTNAVESTPIASAPERTSAPSYSMRGKKYPYTGQFFPEVDSPPGYDGFECYRIPEDGTVFAAVVVAGEKTNTRFDSKKSTIILPNGNEIEISDVTIDPKKWPKSLQSVSKGAVVCTQ